MRSVAAFSDATISLFSALLGAIVGGAASLAGSILVNRWSRASDARLRLYEELIPAAMRQIGDLEANSYDSHDFYNFRQGSRTANFNDALNVVRRASVVAGRQERREADAILHLWDQAQWAHRSDARREAIRSIYLDLDALLRMLERRLD